MAAVLIVVGWAMVAGTAILTAARYGDLPERVAIHFGFDGRANNYGPRALIRIVVGVQVLCIVSYVAIYRAGAPIAILVGTDFIVALCASLQAQVIAAAVSGSNRISTVPLFGFAAAALIVSLVARHFPR